MSRAPSVIAASVIAASVAWTIHLGAGADPFSVASGLTIAVGLVVLAVIDAAGLLLSRGRWARNLGFVLSAAAGGLFIATDATPASVIAIASTSVFLVGLAGPWLDGWIRTRPSADGPGARPLGVVFGLLALVPLVGLASPAGLTTAHGVLGGVAVFLVWSYSRAQIWSLWAIRLGLAFVALPAVLASPWAGAIVLALGVAVPVTFSWFRESLLAVAPLLERLPGPRVSAPARSEEQVDE